MTTFITVSNSVSHITPTPNLKAVSWSLSLCPALMNFISDLSSINEGTVTGDNQQFSIFGNQHFAFELASACSTFFAGEEWLKFCTF